MKKVRLVLFEDTFGVGGIETFLMQICERIDQNIFDVTLVMASKLTNKYDCALKEHGIRVVPLLGGKELNPLKRFSKALPRFWRLLKDLPVDIIHFNISDGVDLAYVFLAKLRGVRVRIVHSHNSRVNAKWKLIAHRVCKALFHNSANYYFACSTEAALWLVPRAIFDSGDYQLIMNGIDFNSFRFDEKTRRKVREERRWNGHMVVANVARFNAQKNHMFLIDVFRRIRDVRDDALLVLVGDGALKSSVMSHVRDIGLADSVIFIGESDQVPQLMQGFDVMVLPSLYEGLPYTVVEAQASSLPSVISDVVTDMVVFSDLVKKISLNESKEKWAKTVVAMASHNRAQDYPMDSRFDISKVVERLQNLYIEMDGKTHAK